jgi:hypothetical protein
MTEKHLQILRHSLGIDCLRWYDRHKIDQEPYRNYFATTSSTPDWGIIQELIQAGLMGELSVKWGMNYFYVTSKGISLARKSAKEYAEKTKPSSRSKARYQAYRLSETEESFIEWLTNPYWKDYRKRLGVS